MSYGMKLHNQGINLTLLEDVKDSLELLIFTPKGQRIYDPNYGTLLFSYLDKPIEFIKSRLIANISDAIFSYEPRIELLNISILDSEKLGVYNLLLEFKLLETNEIAKHGINFGSTAKLKK